MAIFFRILKYILWGLLFILIILIIANFILEKVHPAALKVTYGVTFSPKYASYLDLDWQVIYTKIIKDLKVKNLRLPTYWDSIESKSSDYNFEDVDFMLSKAEGNRINVVLVLGERQPRWPECHIPVWAKNLSLSDRRKRLLDFIKIVVERYKDNQMVVAWQVENEPFLKTFGQGCDRYDQIKLKEEVDLVKSLSQKPVVLTDSGELGGWTATLQLSDIFGTTLYRNVYDPILGYTSYPLPPYFYSLKADWVENLVGQKNKRVIVVELQMEPWAKDNNPKGIDPKVQISHFSLQRFKDNMGYFKKTGFDTAYLWGVEWWYWMEKQGHPEYLEYAKTLF